MEKVLLYVIAASGLCADSSFAPYQYHFVYDLKSWSEARNYCRENFADLASIHNLEDVKTLTNMADLSKMVYPPNSYRAWFGLYNDVESSSRWLTSKRDFESEFRNWSPGEPNGMAHEHCACMDHNGAWHDYRCAKRFKAVCCDVKGTNVAFVYIDTSMTWTEAQSYCRAHYTDLASARNMPENQKVKEQIPPGQIAWIGLYRDPWKWTNGNNSLFRYWRSEEPNDDLRYDTCVAANLEDSGKWEDWPCHWKRAFICYSVVRVQHVMKVRLMTDSSVDLSDPAVMDNMLKQLKQKLKDHGVKEDVKLSWKRHSDGQVFHKSKKEMKKRELKDDL